MKVLLTADQLRRAVPGGVGTYVRGLTRGLHDVGVATALWASRPPRRGPDAVAELGKPVLASRLPTRLLTRAWDTGRVPAPGKPGEWDVVHATSLAVPPAPIGSPLTVMVHDVAWRSHPDAFPPRGRRWHEAALGRAVERAVVLFVPSTQTANALMSDGVAGARIEVVPLGSDHLPPADHEGLTEVLDRAGQAPAVSFVLAVGTVEPRKNLPRLVAAYRRARPQLRQPWPLVIIGPAGWGKELQPDPDGSVVILGPQPPAVIAAAYERCQLFVSVPLLEGYGLPVVEAMAHGAAVVTSAVPSAGDAAYIVDPLNVAAVTEGIVRVAGDERLREDLVGRGRRQAAAHTWAACARAHVAVWREQQ